MPELIITNALPYENKTLVLAAGAEREIPARHGYLSVVSITSGEEDSISISYTGSRYSRFPKGFYLTGFIADRVWIRNDSANQVTVTIGIGSGELRDSRVNIDTNTTIPVVGNVGGKDAHDAAITGNPVLVGAAARTATPAAVAQGDVTRLQSDIYGRLVALPYSLSENYINGISPVLAGAAGSDVIIAAQGAGIRTYLTSLLIYNSNATPGEWQLLDGATIVMRGYIAANAQVNIPLPTPLKGTANTAWNITQVAASALYASAVGFVGP